MLFRSDMSFFTGKPDHDFEMHCTAKFRYRQCDQRPTSIRRVLYVERLTAGSTATDQFFCDLPSKSLCQACWAANLS